jgi:hypothetical protein
MATAESNRKKWRKTKPPLAIRLFALFASTISKQALSSS